MAAGKEGGDKMTSTYRASLTNSAPLCLETMRKFNDAQWRRHHPRPGFCKRNWRRLLAAVFLKTKGL